MLLPPEGFRFRSRVRTPTAAASAHIALLIHLLPRGPLAPVVSDLPLRKIRLIPFSLMADFTDSATTARTKDVVYAARASSGLSGLC